MNLELGSPVATSTTPDTIGRSCFCVGGLAVEITGGLQDVTLIRPLIPFQSAVEVSDISIRVEWVSDLLPLAGFNLFDSGSVWRLYQEDAELRLQFDFSAPTLGRGPYKRLLVDREFRKATLQMNGGLLSGLQGAVTPLDYPLDELLIMHRLTQEKAIELHGCGIVCPDGSGNLFVGHSEAGKSTTARLWTSCGEFDVLSDDRIIVRECAKRPFMYGTPWHGEAAFASPANGPVSRIFVLEHGHGNVLTPLSKPQAVAELFARSFVPFYRHEYVESALEFLQTLVGSVPCYRYAFQPDRSAVETILNLHD